METTKRMIRLESNDKQIRELERSLCEMSATLKDLLDLESGDEELQSESASTPIPLIRINAVILDKVILWLNYHYNRSDGQLVDNYGSITQFDEQLFSSDTQTLFDLLFAANYLNIREMQIIGSKLAAKQLMDKSAEEVRHLWSISTDYSTQEEETLRTDYEWTDRDISISADADESRV